MDHLALTLAGAIGSGTAIVHGVLTQKLMVRPAERAMAGDPRISSPIHRLVPLLLQYSTFSWLVGGLALIAAAYGRPEARLGISLLVGSSFLYGAVANCWGTRGRHPGWMLMAVAVVLIIVDIVRTGA